MNSDPIEFGNTRTVPTRKSRPPRPTKPAAHPGTDATAQETASPAAVDEVFAMLARNVERMQQSHARVHGPEHSTPADEPQADLGTAPSSPSRSQRSTIDPATIRDLDAEMDRQHKRLAQLLRDIDAASAAD